MTRWNLIVQQLIIFGIFGAAYYGLEILYDGTSHWGMFVCAGLTGNAASYLISRHRRSKMIKKSVIITGVILLLELISGYILNIYLELNVWDYTLLPYNLHGQICVQFALIWFFIFSPLILWMVPAIKWTLFGDKKPKNIFSYYYMMMSDILDLVLFRFIRIKNVVSK